MPITSCDFDNGLCDGWRLSDSGVFNWTRHSGPTQSRNTGPYGDHTSGSGKGNVIYFHGIIFACFILFSMHILTRKRHNKAK